MASVHARRPVAAVAILAVPVLVGLLIATEEPLVVLAGACLILGVAVFKERTTDALLLLGLLSLTFSGIAIGALTLPDLFLIPAGLLLILRSLIQRNVYIAGWVLASAVPVMAGGILPHLLLTSTPPRSGTILVQFAASLLYVPIVMALASRSYRDLRRFAGCYVLAAAISSLFALLHFVGISDIASRLTGFQGLIYNAGRVEGLAAHPNQLGLSSALALPFNLYLYSNNRKWAATLPLLLAGVMVSGSRAGLIAFLLGATVHLWRHGKFSLPALAKATALAFLALAIASQFGLDPAVRRLLGAFPDIAEANDARSQGISEAIGDVVRHPFTGVGFGDVPHNLYLELVHGAGILALIGFLWYAKRLLKTAWLYRDIGVVHSAGVAMAVWLVTGLVQPGLYDRYLYFAPGVLLAAHRLAHTCPLEREPSELPPSEQLQQA